MTITEFCTCFITKALPSGRFYLGQEQCDSCGGIVATQRERRLEQARRRAQEVDAGRRARRRAKGGLDPVTGQTSSGCTWCGAHTHRPHHPQCPGGGENE